MTRFFLMLLGIFLAIIGAGWLLGSVVLGLAVALLAFGVWGIWVGERSPLQLQPVPLIAFVLGVAILIFKAGAWLG